MIIMIIIIIIIACLRPPPEQLHENGRARHGDSCKPQKGRGVPARGHVCNHGAYQSHRRRRMEEAYQAVWKLGLNSLSLNT